MQRVVVTGLGILSSIGNSLEEVLAALRHSSSGLQIMPQAEEFGFKCRVFGPVKDWDPDRLGRKVKQTMSTAAQFAAGAAIDAIKDAGIEKERLRSDRTGIIVGTAFGGINEIFRIEKFTVMQKKPSRSGMTGIVKIMNSTAAGNLAAYLGVQGRTYSVSSSFASGTDNIGLAYELIKFGSADVCICGAAEEDCWKQLAAYFDNWDGMPRDWNDRPSEACRPYDRDRQGFVMSSGAGILILEALEHARRRGAWIYGEIIGYGSANDGADLFRPTGKGLKRAISQALIAATEQGINNIDYINTHGTGTPLGDRVEVEVIKEIFGNSGPLVSSTKGLTGHGLGAAGAQEAVYTLLMLSDNFVAPTVNLENVAPECAGIPHVQSTIEKDCDTVMSFSVGLGGANSCIILRRCDFV